MNTTTTEIRTFGNFTVDDVTSAPLRVTRSFELNANQQAVFDFLTHHEGWTSWFPILTAVSVNNEAADTAGGNGAIRHCTLVNGAQFSENIIGYDAPHSFGYAIEANNPLGIENHLAMVQITPTAEGNSHINWYQYFDHADLDAMTAQVNEALDGGFQNLIGRFGGQLF